MKKIGIGYENYKEFVDQDLYYVDKTLLVRDILRQGGKVTLFTRPRRFGKTLALSMLRTFFEDERDREGNKIDNSHYFECMRIMDCGNEILSKMGKYPVIHLSLKSAKQPDFYTAFMKLREEIIGEFDRHYYLKGSDKLPAEMREAFASCLANPVEWTKTVFADKQAKEEAFRETVAHYSTALKTLSDCLKLYHGQNVVILLDEYDVPLENAYYGGFYDDMVGFIRSLFESCLKTNDALEFAVITGCLRISRESIFTGLNHLEIVSIRNERFSEGFGFTQAETEQMLMDYDLKDKVEEVGRWYDGYLFGSTEIYNPWSVIKYVSVHTADHNAFAEPYWANTSSNSIIKDLIENADDKQKRELEHLIDGGIIEKYVHEDITYDEIYSSEDNLWNFLFFTGYLKKVSEKRVRNEIVISMCIPNIEVKCVYVNHIRTWFEKRIKEADRSILYRAVKEQDTEKMSDFVTDLLEKSISTFDSDEAFYHGFLLSLLVGMPSYAAQSNREEGNGRPDIVLYPQRPKDSAYVIEIKIRKKFSEMEEGINEAFAQIRDQRYEEGILDDGYAGAVSYGVCFCKKACLIARYPAQ